MDKEKLEPISFDADPDRCQGSTSKGQCTFKGVRLPDGSYGTHCMVHGGNQQLNSAKMKSLRNYRLTKWQAKLDRFAESDVIKSLREEIGILRVLLEERLEHTEDVQTLLLQSGPISDLVMKIERVVTSCHKLEDRMGQHLDKAAILQLASRFVRVISEELADQPDKIDVISQKLLEIIQEDNNEI